ncbi:MAG: aspartyl protease family protein [Bacteroidetes bacterium]|nr:aspartyl protease family protein [Bacteroidota bacterium]
MKLIISIPALLLFICLHGYSQDTIALSKYLGNLKTVEVTIDGKKYNFLFDSGGGATFIAPSLIRNSGREIFGDGTGYRMSGEKIRFQKTDSITLQLGHTLLFNQDACVWDIMSVLPTDVPELYGIISLNSFRNKILTIDLSHSRLIVETPLSYRKKQMNQTLLRSRFASGITANELDVLISIPRQHHAYWFLFDSGNLDDLLLSHSTAREWKLESGVDSLRNRLSTIPFHIGNEDLNVQAAANDLIYDGALNYDLICRYVFMINFISQEVWMLKE